MSWIAFRLEGLPPTTNHIWRNVGRGRVVLTEKARAYYESTPWEIAAQLQGARLAGQVEVEITFYPKDRRPWDLDNRAKAIIDSMVKSGCIDDDQNIVRLTLEKGELSETWKHGGVRVYAQENKTAAGARAA